MQLKMLLCVLTVHLVACRPPAEPSLSRSGGFQWDLEAENHTGYSRDAFAEDGKHRGMTAFDWRDHDDEAVNQLVKNNIEWVAIVPFLFQKGPRTKQVHPRDSIGLWDYRDSIYLEVIADLKARDMHIMLKPHIWMKEGWRSEISLDTEAEWATWFDAYGRHMLHYARMAEYAGVELFCVGTELRSSVTQLPSRWEGLIREIRSVYSGKLTYAANWDDTFTDIPFWDQLDYIGVQAYFPLTQHNRPSLAEIEAGWSPYVTSLRKLSLQYDIPILFTETGYRSDESATVKPWEWGIYQDTTGATVSNETQLYAYEALFRQLWHEDWFAGVYFWQWHNRHDSLYTINNVDFTPRYKPAENMLARWYGK